MTGRAVIVGAGIAGLTAGVALARAGWDVSVLEQAPALEEIGAGLQVGPNGMRILDALGITPRLEAALFEPETIEMRLGGSDRLIFRLPIKNVSTERWGARYVQVHRADLIEAMKDSLLELVPSAIRTGVQVTDYGQSAGSAWVVTASGERFSGDLIIGADGIHSVIRQKMLGADRPRFTGNVAWRAIVPVDRLDGLVPPPSGVVWAGAGRHAVTTRIRAGSVVNFVGLVEQDGWREEGWYISATRDEAMSVFGGWTPVLDRLLDRADQIHRWSLHDRPPLPQWSDGRVVLTGDACHPMLPSLAQGAVQAMEDAAALVRALSGSQDVADAGKAYFRARIARASRVQRRSAANVRLFHRRTALGQLAHYAPIHAAYRLAPWVFPMRLDWLYAA